MRTIFTFLFATLLTLGCAACSSNPQLQEFQVEGEDFAIALPTPYEEGVQVVNLEGVRVELFTYTAKEPNLVYILGYADFPEEMVRQQKPQEILNDLRDAMMQDMEAAVVSDDSVALDKHPGRELVIDAKAGNGIDLRGKARIFLVNNRIYQFVIVSRKDEASNTLFDNFLQSFTLLDA